MGIGEIISSIGEFFLSIIRFFRNLLFSDSTSEAPGPGPDSGPDPGPDSGPAPGSEISAPGPPPGPTPTPAPTPAPTPGPPPGPPPGPAPGPPPGPVTTDSTVTEDHSLPLGACRHTPSAEEYILNNAPELNENSSLDDIKNHIIDELEIINPNIFSLSELGSSLEKYDTRKKDSIRLTSSFPLESSGSIIKFKFCCLTSDDCFI